MEEKIIFIKISEFTSKKNNTTYYTVEYLRGSDLKYFIDFVDVLVYTSFKNKKLQALKDYKAVYTIDEYRNVKIKDIAA